MNRAEVVALCMSNPDLSVGAAALHLGFGPISEDEAQVCVALMRAEVERTLTGFDPAAEREREAARQRVEKINRELAGAPRAPVARLGRAERRAAARGRRRR